MRNTRWCSGKSTASHRCDAGANSGDDTMSEMSLFLILSLTLSGFSLVTPVFLCPQKPGMVAVLNCFCNPFINLQLYDQLSCSLVIPCLLQEVKKFHLKYQNLVGNI